MWKERKREGKGEMGDGRDREEGVKGVWSGPLFNEDPNQPSRGCPETPGSLDQKNQTAGKEGEGRRGGTRP